MDTDKLIDTLSGDLRPVKPLPSPLCRATGFSAAAIVIAAVFSLAAGVRDDAMTLAATPRFAAEIVLMAVSGFLSAFAAFHLSIPDTKIRRPVLLAVLAATTGWLFLALACCAGVDDMIHGHADYHCLRDLAVLAVMPVVAAFVLLSRGAPVWSGFAGYGMALSAASFSAAALRFLCANDNHGHLLLWHYIPVIVLALLGILLGKAVIKWKNRSI